MNEIAIFIQKHPHCTKFVCTTCGGQIGFQMDLNQWLALEKPDLASLVTSLSFEDLAGIRDWPIFLDLIISRLPEPERLQLMALARQPSFRHQVEFGLLAIKHALPDSFSPDLDTDWVVECIQDVIEKKKGYEIDFLLRYLGSNASLFPELAVCKLEIQQFRQAEQAKATQRRNEDEELRKAKQVVWEERIAQLSRLSPLERLETILQESSHILDEYPDDWAAIPIENFYGFDSVRLTQIIKQMDKKMIHQRGVWKDLRTALYHLRQSIYNQEKGFRK